MSEFDVNGYNSHECDIHNHGYYLGAQSQQAKIDCMKVELDGANERAMMMFNHKNAMVDKMQAKIDELQKRIDDASNKIDFWVGGKNGDAIHVAKSIGNILKGNKDEN